MDVVMILRIVMVILFPVYVVIGGILSGRYLDKYIRNYNSDDKSKAWYLSVPFIHLFSTIAMASYM